MSQIYVHPYDFLDATLAELITKAHWQLNLSTVKTITADAARILGSHWKYRKDWDGRLQSADIDLSGLTQMSVETASCFADFRGKLRLNGLSILTDEVAEALGKLRGGLLELNGITSFSTETAKGILPYLQQLNLKNIPDFYVNQDSLEEAFGYRNEVLIRTDHDEFFSINQPHLSLKGLNSMESSTASVLAQGRPASIIDLSGLDTIDANLASALRDYPGEIHLNGTAKITHQAIREICIWRSSLSMDTTNLSRKHRLYLARYHKVPVDPFTQGRGGGLTAVTSKLGVRILGG